MRRVLVILAMIIGIAASGVQVAAGRVPLGAEPAGVDRTATLTPEGTITIGGALDCPAGTPARIKVTLAQSSTGATGEGEWSGTCSGEGPSRAHRSQRWETVVSPTSSAGFAPGAGDRGASFEGVVTFGDVTDTWTQEPINLVRD